MSDGIPPQYREIIEPLMRLPFSDPPSPWSEFSSFSEQSSAAGFSDDGDYLFATTEAGRRVFDCRTHQCVARDRRRHFPYDVRTLEAEGIGPLAERMIRVAGVDGGGLPLRTRDGWRLHRMFLCWPSEFAFLSEPGADALIWQAAAGITKLHVTGEFRTLGFSPCNRHMLAVNSGGIYLSSRD